MSRSIRQRRLKGKTDYKTRLALLKSGRLRLVVRKTNRYMIAQLIETNIAQDKVVVGITSNMLLSKGWPKEKSGSLKSIPAAYLTGLALAKLAKSEIKNKEIVLDMGMYRNIQKSRIYAVLKGAVDGGLKIPHGEHVLPTEKELARNKSLSEILEKLKGKL
jgi:large subunit ribosomal protein L18